MTVSNEVIDSLLANYKKPEDLIGEHGILKQLTKRLVERALEVELADHLGHALLECDAKSRILPLPHFSCYQLCDQLLP
jgi:hypothetical protein